MTQRHRKQVKALGREVKNFDEADWKSKCRKIITTGGLGKFQHNQALGEYLILTAGTAVAEASPFDRVWGIGLRAGDERAKDLTQWRRTSLLGFVLMDVQAGLVYFWRPLGECQKWVVF